MIKLFAPYPDFKIVIFLPSAEWGDSQRLESTMQLHRSMNDLKKITHVRKIQDVRAFEVSLILTRDKSLEYLTFLEIFGAEKMELTLHDGPPRIGYMRVNPIELEVVKRAIVCTSVEEVVTRFDFETIQ